MKRLIYILATAAAVGVAACGVSGPVTPDETGGAAGTAGGAPIYPDYADVTIPVNIAPMNFTLTEPYDEARVTFAAAGESFTLRARGGQFTIPRGRWSRMLAAAAGDSVTVTVTARRDGRWRAYDPFAMHVATEPSDPYIAYRLIEPGYDLWMTMGIYQRDLGTYRQSPILENRLTGGSCMNCHSFPMQDPETMLLHLRGPVAGTMVIRDGEVEKLNTKTPETMSNFVYPGWHPSGRYVAFSLNDTRQAFHMNNLNRVEVFDFASDLVVYDVEKHEVVTSPLLHGTTDFESTPAFSPDGRTLYFCSSSAVTDLPLQADSIRYSLCSIPFDPDTRRLGTRVDTLYNARTEGGNATFPRPSPDGRWLLYTLSSNGAFGIWHKEADLWIIDLATGQHRPLGAANSPTEADSYHSWSSNSRWVVFSSRRIDGLYTRAHIAYVDPDGRSGKAFVVPQKDVGYYDRLMYSYNVPEFIRGRVPDLRRKISTIARKQPGTEVKFAGYGD